MTKPVTNYTFDKTHDWRVGENNIVWERDTRIFRCYLDACRAATEWLIENNYRGGDSIRIVQLIEGGL